MGSKDADKLTYKKEPDQTVSLTLVYSQIMSVNTKTLDNYGTCKCHWQVHTQWDFYLYFSSVEFKIKYKRIFRLKVTSFSNNFKIFVSDSLIGYFHIV